MAVESETDRLDYLETWGVCVRVDGHSVQAIFDSSSGRSDFEGIRVSTTGYSLRCLWSDVLRYEIGQGMPVEVPEEGEFYIAAEPDNEEGMAFIELRQDRP